MENLKYNYLHKKIVDIKTKEEMNFYDTKGITVLKNKNGNSKLEIDTAITSISEVMKGFDTENLLDINISNIPLENIITEIYKEKANK